MEDDNGRNDDTGELREIKQPEEQEPDECFREKQTEAIAAAKQAYDGASEAEVGPAMETGGAETVTPDNCEYSLAVIFKHGDCKITAISDPQLIPAALQNARIQTVCQSCGKKVMLKPKQQMVMVPQQPAMPIPRNSAERKALSRLFGPNNKRVI